ncbi:ATP-binding protein [Desulfosporosinus sp. SB140]|uniref:ATP-binding protein n=1 Tax=Desulfosporosinus paludis TaxID=3115649 RepID=UPI00388E6F40
MIVARFDSIKDWEHFVDLKREIIQLKEQRVSLRSMVEDITKQLKIEIEKRESIEQELAKLGRLNIIGQLAAGLGHEIRNPLTTIRGFLQMLKCKAELVTYTNYFELMIEELDRANAIITDYLSLAKNKPTDFKRLHLNKLLENLSPLITADAYSQGKKCIFEPGDIQDLEIDPHEITQMVLNLARNGLEAMPIDGCLTIKTFMNEQDIVLSVNDEGQGIPPEHLSKLGTPFFTTKENGTGLGLAMCYNVANRHNAQIDIDTSQNGTTFFVRFPNQGSHPL